MGQGLRSQLADNFQAQTIQPAQANLQRNSGINQSRSTMLRETEKSVKEAQNSLELLKKRMSKPGEQM